MKVFATYIQVLLHTYTLILICNLRMHVDTRNNVFDLEMQPFYIFLCDTYILHTIGLGLLLYALGGIPFIIWGIVRKQNAFTGLDYVVQLCSMFIVKYFLFFLLACACFTIILGHNELVVSIKVG